MYHEVNLLPTILNFFNRKKSSLNSVDINDYFNVSLLYSLFVELRNTPQGGMKKNESYIRKRGKNLPTINIKAVYFLPSSLEDLTFIPIYEEENFLSPINSPSHLIISQGRGNALLSMQRGLFKTMSSLVRSTSKVANKSVPLNSDQSFLFFHPLEITNRFPERIKNGNNKICNAYILLWLSSYFIPTTTFLIEIINNTIVHTTDSGTNFPKIILLRYYYYYYLLFLLYYYYH